jgi:4-hydroxybenzoate polyprenyltransferase
MMKQTILQRLRTLLILLRVKQWSKNVIIFIPLFFAGGILDIQDFLRTLYAFFAISLLSSSIYIINDIFDVKRDLAHPHKKFRPIPAGEVSVTFALALSVLLFLGSMLTNLLLVPSEYLFVLQVIYFLVMVAYSIWLKHIPIIDALVIAGGFLLRVLAGAIILQIDISAMLAMSVIGGALLISFGKRAAEIHSLTKDEAGEHRPALKGYSIKALDSIISALVAVTFFSYVLLCYDFYKLYLDFRIVDVLPPTMRDSQWLMITVPYAFYGLARYLNVIYKGNAAERPEELWFKDKPLLVTLILWALTLFVFIYFKEVFEVVKMIVHLF